MVFFRSSPKCCLDWTRNSIPAILQQTRATLHDAANPRQPGRTNPNAADDASAKRKRIQHSSADQRTILHDNATDPRWSND